MTKETFFFSVEQGKMKIANRKHFDEVVKNWGNKRGELTLQNKSHRTIQQNRYFWACMDILGKEIGYSKDEMKELVCFKFLKRDRVIEKTGEVMQFILGTSGLNKEDFSELMENVLRWSAQDLGIILPLREQQMDLKFQQ